MCRHVSIGMIGYPNVGKSSVINALKRKKVCKAAPVPGKDVVDVCVCRMEGSLP